MNGSARELVAARGGLAALRRVGAGFQPRFRARARSLGWRHAVLLLPTALAALYYGPIASDRYVSEAQIVIRRGSEQAAAGGFASFLKSAGLGGPDDINVVQAYILSRDAIRGLRQRLPIAEIFGPPGADFIARWPSLIYGTSEEDFYRYYRGMVSVAPNHKTGGLTISAQTFEPAQARAIAAALVELAEEMVNRLNERVRSESIKSATEEVQRSEQELIAAQVALTEFRNREQILDPERNAVLLTELIGKLNAELAVTLAQIAQLRGSAPDNPQLIPLKARAQAIRSQIDAQRSIVSLAGSGLADKVSAYERLNLQQQFAARQLAVAVASLTVAKSQARRQHAFLERIVEPNLPDKSTEPERAINILAVFGWSLLLYLVGWVIGVGIREHAASHEG